MSGVGSTNAMKKGSANNPFLAYSEADMASFLNSAYTGCIVKYAGEPISRYLTEQNKTVPEHVKNLVFSLVDGGFWEFFNSGNIRIKIQQKTNGSTKTLYITPGRYYNGAWHFDKLSFTNSNLYLTDSLTAPTEALVVIQKYFDTEPYWRWNKECVNDQGNLTIWTYDQDVTFTIEQATTEYGIAYDSTHGITIVPYKVNELYKVVYGDGKYYYEEFCHISDTRTTANSDYIAPGKTAFDFTGNLQTGNGSKINPYLAYTVAELQSFPIGSFIKWLGPNKTVLDETTGQMLIHGEVYRAVEDGDVLQYVILPTLSNPGTAADLTQGKQLIDGEGKVVEGTFTDDIDYTQDVMFWDYDGKLIYSCTLDEAKAMTKLPDVPDHSDKGLVFFKWNYTLDDIKNISHGADIGALYETSDGKTHLFFDIVSDLTKDVTLYIKKSYNSQDGTLRIDWGDGTDVEIYEWDKNTTPSSANFPKHTYTMTGQYEVKIENISAYKSQSIYLGSISYSISEARNLFGQSLKSASPNAVSSILIKAYVGKKMSISCGNCINLKEVSLYNAPIAPCGFKYTQVKHVNTLGNINLNAFYDSAIQTFSCSANSIEPGAFQNCSNIKRIACKAYTQTYSDAVSLNLPLLRVCIWPRYSSYRVLLNIVACKKVVLDYVTQWDNSGSSASLYLLNATKLYMKKFYPYGNSTKVAAGIISAPMLEQFIMDNVTPTPLTAAFTKIPNTCKYYVPDSAVDAYKAAEGWSSMADRIYPMSALTN